MSALNPEGAFFRQGVRLDLPDATRFAGPCPVAFFVPATQMSDFAGNGPDYPVRDTLESLSRALNERGIATIRMPGSAQESAPARYAAALGPERATDAEAVLRRLDLDHVALLGVGNGADFVARHYYEFYAARFPRAAVLLSASVQPIHLNNLTCPYLTLHGQLDPLFQVMPYSRVEEAVLHHQMRYGDLTTNFWFADLGHELGEDGYLAPEVVEQVVSWLERAICEGLRPQERSAA